MRFVLAFIAVCMLADVSYGQRFLRHSSTFEEGALRGYGAAVRSRGAANLLNARAATEWQRARRAALQNRRRGVEDFWYLRRLNRQERFGDRQPPSLEQVLNWNDPKRPRRLKQGDRWPALLEAKDFTPYRREIDRILDKPETDIVDEMDVAMAVAQMEKIVKRVAPYIHGNETVAARKFLDSVKYEVRKRNEH